MNLKIEFGICADELSKQLKEYNLPKEKIDSWQSIADFIIYAYIDNAINDNSFSKCNKVLGRIIAKTIEEAAEAQIKELQEKQK